MNKSIWCVMQEDAENSVTVCLGCYESEKEADKAWEYWDSNSKYSPWTTHWIMQTELFGNFEGQMKGLKE